MSITYSKSSIAAIVLAVAATATAQPTADDPDAPSRCCLDKTPTVQQRTSEPKPAPRSVAKPSKDQKAQAQKDQKTPKIDPDAMRALDAMGAFLRLQGNFSVSTDAETDYVLDNGQKVTLPKHTELRVLRPDHARIDVTSDRKDRQFFYDGKTFTMYAEKLGFYSTVQAPPTLNELADMLEDTYGLSLPMVDLFRFGTDQSPAKEVTEATHVGTEKLDGVTTEHYAFRQKGVDWQIWIEKGNRPIPHKLVLTTTDDPARPEYAISMRWALNQSNTESLFTFVPPAGTSEIAMSERSIQTHVRAEQARKRTADDRTEKK